MVSEFIFRGLWIQESQEIPLTAIFCTLPDDPVLGNLFVVFLIITGSHLHSPMYFLLANLSFVDFCLSSVTTPKLVTDFLRSNKTISFGGCMSQILFIHFLAGGEMVLLVSMAYDRCVAICKPLHYSRIVGQTKVHLASTDIMDHWLCTCHKSTSYDFRSFFLWTQNSGQFFCDIPEKWSN